MKRACGVSDKGRTSGKCSKNRVQTRARWEGMEMPLVITLRLCHERMGLGKQDVQSLSTQALAALIIKILIIIIISWNLPATPSPPYLRWSRHKL